MVHTTAVTMCKGSDQANIIPEKSTLVINCRLLPGETVEETQKYFQSIMPQGVEAKRLKGHNPPPVADTDRPGYRLIQQLTWKKYPDMLIIPSFLLGGTDFRWCFDVCPSGSVYRYGFYFHTSKWGPAHRVNERMECDRLTDGAEFFAKYMQRYGDCE